MRCTKKNAVLSLTSITLNGCVVGKNRIGLLPGQKADWIFLHDILILLYERFHLYG